MSQLFQSFTSGLRSLPPHGVGALIVLLLYAVESEIRFGGRARNMKAGSSDRGSTIIVSLASAVPVIGFIIAMRGQTASYLSWAPKWLRASDTLPAMPAMGWLGVGLAALGVLLRLWALLTLRDRYTRTLLVQDVHAIERGGPYRFIRHPGYLGSLLCLNGIAMASGNAVTLLTSIAVTGAAYAYRIRSEDRMLVAAFGSAYDNYRRAVGAVLPLRRRKVSDRY